jgi:hypothetical protein
MVAGPYVFKTGCSDIFFAGDTCLPVWRNTFIESPPKFMNNSDIEIIDLVMHLC